MAAGVIAALAFAPAAPASSGSVTGSKTAAPGDIACDGTAHQNITLDGQTGIAGSPADIMLVLDRSGSMSGALPDLKTAANAFVDEIDEATDGMLDGVIANGSRVGVVSFASAASLDQPLTDSAAASHGAIDALTAGGLTNHQDAFDTAQAQLGGPPPNKFLIMFTDGDTTTGGDPSVAAANARAAGTTIYSIGLGSVVQSALEDWATDPDSEHVFITPSSGDLEAIFQAIGAAIAVPAATDVKVVDVVNPHFSISNVSASKGSVAQVGNTLTWTIGTLGTEQATLTYDVTHDPGLPGGAEVLSSTSYSDAEGKSVAFSDPSVNVRGCPATLDLTPAAATYELGTPGQSHAVQAELLDDFGDPIGGSTIDFDVTSGPNSGNAGSAATDGAGLAGFSYVAQQGLAGLGTDAIGACLSGTSLCDTAEATWQDTTAPDASCGETVNPAGTNVPKAFNEDGFFVLSAEDAVDPDPQLFVLDTGSGTVFGPFDDGTRIKYTEAKGAKPNQKPMTGAVDWHITGNGDAAVFATDASGNRSANVACNVPPPPK